MTNSIISEIILRVTIAGFVIALGMINDVIVYPIETVVVVMNNKEKGLIALGVLLVIAFLLLLGVSWISLFTIAMCLGVLMLPRL